MKHSHRFVVSRRDNILVPAVALMVAILTLFASGSLFAAGEERFNSPEDAVKALTSAAENRDTNAMRAIFGPAGHQLVSADLVQKAEEYRAFEERLTNKVDLVHESDSKVALELGQDSWPFAIPLVKADDKWYFDTEAGREEILNRRIGMNELGAINVCRAYVDAQREYASRVRNGDDVLEYAQHLRSTPNTHDGLFWHVEPGEPLSPLGPLISEAHAEGYRQGTKIMTEEQSPYHGYYFKILTKQGRNAPAGKLNYVLNGHMLAGFALVAWPAQWGNSGVMTFIVSKRGRIYQKNLGPKTAQIAAAMTSYDPDNTWTPVR